MANEEHLAKLKEGVEAWNAWRNKNRAIHPDFSEADLSEVNLERADLSDANLSGANLSGAHLSENLTKALNLREANLREADLSGANLSGAYLAVADLSYANLIGANLSGAHLIEADLIGANLGGANFSGAKLIVANLFRANLFRADLSEADLSGANLGGANLGGANLGGAVLAYTILSNLDLATIIGLEEINHQGPSYIDTHTLSEGRIPKDFLRGCGLSDWEILSAKLYDPDLSESEVIDINYEITDLRTHGPIQINPLFISYTRDDSPFVEAMETKLTKDGVRYWRDVHDMKAGRMEKQIDRAIRHNPTVLLVLSEESVESDWVEYEVRQARDLEKELKRDVLCPVALDEAWKTCDWPRRLRVQVEEYNILDFSDWKNKAAMDRQYRKLVEGIHLFYERGKPNST